MDEMIHDTGSLDGITPARLGGCFVGWPSPPSPATHLRLLAGSMAVELALDAATGQTAGFINAVGDGVLAACISLLEVLPRYQGRGIGGELARRMLARLDGLYMIDLLCDPALQPFYARFGMRSSQGMLIRNYGRQSGQ